MLRAFLASERARELFLVGPVGISDPYLPVARECDAATVWTPLGVAIRAPVGCDLGESRPVRGNAPQVKVARAVGGKQDYLPIR